MPQRKAAGYFLFMFLLISAPLLAQEQTPPPKGKFSGLVFGDYFYNVARDTAIGRLSDVGTGGEKSMQGFQLRRAYFTYDYDLSEMFTSCFRIDADQSALSSDGKIGIYLRDAFLRWKNVFHGSDLYIGMHPTPAFDVSETFWSYRALEKTIMDLRGIVSSRDLGVALRGKLDDEGTVSYWAMVGNNSSNKPETDKYKRYYLSVQLKPSGNFLATLYGDYKSQSNIDDPTSTTTPRATLSHGSFTSALFAGYTDPGQFILGLEGFLQSTANDYHKSGATGLSSRNAIGISLFGWVNVQSDLSVVARYDYFDPNTDSNVKGDMRSYMVGGISWRPD